MLTWSAAFSCFAQDARIALQREPDLRAKSSSVPNLTIVPSVRDPRRPWLLAAAGTTAALAAGFALSEGFSYKANTQSVAAFERSRDLRLSMETRTRSLEQSTDAKFRSELLDKVSSVCLAGSIAATGTMLLVWLTGKERRKPNENKYLLGPMVLREWAGAGLVLREKF
jgi:hypothetical protein